MKNLNQPPLLSGDVFEKIDNIIIMDLVVSALNTRYIPPRG